MGAPAIVVVGGGASGLSAAISAARMGAAVTVLEAAPRVGKKILATGNGRCNLSNTHIRTTDYNNPAFVAPVLTDFPPERIRAFFGALGLSMYDDSEGRVYPTTNLANSVLDVLRLECDRLGVVVRCDARVISISKRRDAFELDVESGERIRGAAVVVGTGGGTHLLRAVGHQEVPTSPVLCPIETDRDPIRGLSGVKVRCCATLWHPQASDSPSQPLASERGELLFRDYGVSGVMVFDLSRHLIPGSTLSIDFFPDVSTGELEAELAARAVAFGDRTADAFFVGTLHPRVALAILRRAEIPPSSPVPELDVVRLARTAKEFRLSVIGPADARNAQVTRGGADVEEFSPATLESRKVRGLFAAGEALDVDGRCGGYNLHWAWASGIRAGESAAAFVGSVGSAEIAAPALGAGAERGNGRAQ